RRPGKSLKDFWIEFPQVVAKLEHSELRITDDDLPAFRCRRGQAQMPNLSAAPEVLEQPQQFVIEIAVFAGMHVQHIDVVDAQGAEARFHAFGNLLRVEPRLITVRGGRRCGAAPAKRLRPRLESPDRTSQVPSDGQAKSRGVL